MISLFYREIFLGVVGIWPLYLYEIVGPAISLPLEAVNLLVMFTVARQCSSPELSFYQGLGTICGSMSSGCSYITVLYLPLLLVLVYLKATFDSLVSLVLERSYAQQRWARTVDFFVKHRVPEQASPVNRGKRPQDLTIDYDDPESLLNAGVINEQHGRWAEALRLYQLAAGLPDGNEHCQYVVNCISSCKKKSLSRNVLSARAKGARARHHRSYHRASADQA